MPLQHPTHWLIPTQVGDRTVLRTLSRRPTIPKRGFASYVWKSSGAQCRRTTLPGTCCDQVMSRSVMQRMLFSFRPFVNRGSTSTRDCHSLPLGTLLRLCFEEI